MISAPSALSAILLMPVLAGCAATQTNAQPQPGVGTTVGPSTPPRRPPSYTGFDISVSATLTIGGGETIDFPVVRTVAPDSPAQRAGLKPGDVIVEINGSDTREPTAMRMEPGVRYALRIRRGAEELEVVLVPAPPRDPAPRAMSPAR